MTRVKICGVRSAEMAEAASAAGADAIGFVFYAKSSRAVTAMEAAAVVRETPALVTTVGLFVNATADEVSRILDCCPLDCLQFHGGESAAFCQQFGRPYIKVISMRPEVDIPAELREHSNARAILFDAWRADAPGGTGDTFAWERLPTLERPWILAGGLTADNVGAAIAQLAPPAVDVSGGVESAPGKKDPTRMREFIHAVREADKRKHEDAAA
ncbi:phosphoribosylanthranilate isomerase [Congregibacter litoralis]|uniref:N-(5'-phosphoribosyl)anthranilate isomerase n=1 Tax=Congregibacter litoralis KT71 TaxID=314285 RepID=V7HS81_9GAMM|nr:phosphoribosylanthranilate isomerase [Congregibacter litoralis]ESZ89418.1 phosphoribosylanthranilate isomerase [Congregibacter litoralis KT71]